MSHPIFRVQSFEIVADYTLSVLFDDGTQQTIDFRPILAGELYGPLRETTLFNAGNNILFGHGPNGEKSSGHDP